MIPPRAAEILDVVRPLAARFDARGHRLYLVGGVVRDLVIDREDVERNDLDLTTDATPDIIKDIVRPISSALSRSSRKRALCQAWSRCIVPPSPAMTPAEQLWPLTA